MYFKLKKNALVEFYEGVIHYIDVIFMYFQTDVIRYMVT